MIEQRIILDDVFYFNQLKDIYYFVLTLKYKIRIADLEEDSINSKKIICIQDFGREI